MKKQVISLMLAGAMTVSLAACGGGSDSKDAAKGNADTNAGGETGAVTDDGGAAAQLDVENVEDIYVTWPSLGGAPADMQMVEDAVNDIVESKIGVHAVFLPTALSDLTNQQQLLISSGEKLDLVCMLWTGLDQWVNTESVLELEELLPTYGAGIVESFGDAAFAANLNDHVYAVPMSQSGYAYGFYARTDMLEKYGFDTADRVVTVEELEEIFAAVKEGEGAGYYPVAGGGSFECLEKVDTLGGSTYSGVVMPGGDTTKVVNLYETEEFKAYADRMYQWAQAGYISPDAATTEDSVQTLIASGSYMGAFSQMGESTKASYGSGGSVPLTQLTIVEGYTRTQDLMSLLWGVSSTCESPEKAVAFLNEMYTNPDLSNLLMYGVEGTHYVVAEESEEGTLIDFPEGVDMSSSGYYVFLGVWDMAVNKAWTTSGYKVLTEKEERKGYEMSPAFGYLYNSADCSNEMTALNATWNEYYKIIDCGAIDPTQELTSFVDALKANNIDKVIADNQAQYDEWMSAK